MTEAQRFRERLVYVEAMQWDGTAAGAGPVIDWVLATGGTARYVDYADDTKGRVSLHVDSPAGTRRAFKDYWIVRDDSGRFFGFPPDVFAAAYEPWEES